MSEEKILDEDPRLDNEHWAGVLVQALPYFKHWVGKIVVVKYGGNAMLNEELKHDVMEDIVLLSTIGIHVVLVHGGGPEINNMLQRVGKESKFVNGLRYTDGETMDIVQMVLTGKLNKDIVGILLQQGGKAVGLSGVDSGLLRAKKISKDGADLGFVGEVTQVNPEIIQSLLSPNAPFCAFGTTKRSFAFTISHVWRLDRPCIALRLSMFHTAKDHVSHCG